MRKTKFALTKGFQDFYPLQQAKQQWLFGKMRAAAKKFGYQEYDGPALESLALYAAKSGDELVKKQTFVLQDRSGAKLALRPEMTPTLARMIAQKQGELTMPLRWFNIGPRWRYETPQKGRTRQFIQWDVDLIGPSTPEADAEVIAVAAEFLKSIGLKPNQVVIKINDRRFLENKLKLIGIPAKKIIEVFRAIDKKDKMALSTWQVYLKKIGLNKLQIKDLQSLLQDQDYSQESESLTQLFSTLKDLDADKWVEFDPTITRGLDYYTGVVFEARDQKNEFRAILGGGRYDNLVEVVGGQPLSGIGFALGDMVITEILKKFKLLSKLNPCPTQVLVTVFDASTHRHSLKLAAELRKKGISTEIYPEAIRLDKQFKYADKKNIPWVAILGPDETANKTITLKNMKTSQQTTIDQAKISRQLFL